MKFDITTPWKNDVGLQFADEKVAWILFSADVLRVARGDEDEDDDDWDDDDEDDDDDDDDWDDDDDDDDWDDDDDDDDWDDDDDDWLDDDDDDDDDDDYSWDEVDDDDDDDWDDEDKGLMLDDEDDFGPEEQYWFAPKNDEDIFRAMGTPGRLSEVRLCAHRCYNCKYWDVESPTISYREGSCEVFFDDDVYRCMTDEIPDKDGLVCGRFRFRRGNRG